MYCEIYRKHSILLLISVLIVGYLLKIEEYDYSASVEILDRRAEEVWKFLANFSNTKYLNPTIMSFEIISEFKNLNSWKYSVKYEERLSHWPYIRNYAIANVTTDFDHSDDTSYFINSTHRTCFLKNIFCLESKGKFLIRSNSPRNSVECTEKVTFQCPMLMSAFCLREVVYQRNHILEHLKNHFEQQPNLT